MLQPVTTRTSGSRHRRDVDGGQRRGGRALGANADVRVGALPRGDLPLGDLHHPGHDLAEHLERERIATQPPGRRRT